MSRACPAKRFGYVEPVFNTVMATQVINQGFLKKISLINCYYFSEIQLLKETKQVAILHLALNFPNDKKIAIMKTENIAQQISDGVNRILPSGLSDTRKDLHNNIKALVTESLSKLNVVTREEFDTQAAVLAKTRAKLDALEKQLEQLEKGK